MVRILICDEMEAHKLALGSNFQIDYMPTIGREELLRLVGEYDALVVRSRTKVDKELIDKASKLKLIARPGTGLDNIDLDYAKSKGIQVASSPESLVEAVSEHVILLALALSRKLVRADAGVKEGKWEKNSLVGSELKGKMMGIVGLGRIGRRIAEIAGALGMNVLAYDVITIPPDVISKLNCKVVSLDELFLNSDFITLHVPMTPESRHMVGDTRLAQMKRGAFLINTSRGGVVDEGSLADCLKRGQIGGAALDVFEEEPPSVVILSAPNTILTPHIGGQTAEAQADAISVIGEKVRSFFGRA